MKTFSRSLVVVLFALAPLSLAGCGGGGPAGSTPNGDAQGHHDEHDHGHGEHAHGEHGHGEHDHGEHGHVSPESLPEAMVRLRELRDTIQKAFAEGEAANADGAVHEVGHVLEALPTLLAKQSLTEEQQQVASKAVASLFEAFAALDERIHQGEPAGKSYADVSETIDAAITELGSVVKEEPAA